MCSLVLYGLQRAGSRAWLLPFLGQYQGPSPSKEHANTLAILVCLNQCNTLKLHKQLTEIPAVCDCK